MHQVLTFTQINYHGDYIPAKVSFSSPNILTLDIKVSYLPSSSYPDCSIAVKGT